MPDMDEFYFNIIGPGWQDTTISNVTFTIQMPGAFDEENLGMTSGVYGSGNYEDLYYYIEDNTIYGELDPSVTLQPNECVTVRLELPEGYFVKTDTTPWLAWIAIALGIISVFIAFFMWWFIGRDDPVIETIEYHAPDGMNCLNWHCLQGTRHESGCNSASYRTGKTGISLHFLRKQERNRFLDHIDTFFL